MAITKYDYGKRRQKRLEKYLSYFFKEASKQLGKVEQKKVDHSPGLSEKEHEYLQLMEKAFYWRSQFFSPDQVRKLIMQHGSYSYSMACQVYADAEHLFGNVDETNKEALRKTLTEYYHKAIQTAMKARGKEIEQAHVIIKATAALAELHNLLESESRLNAKELMPPVTFVIQSAGVTNNVLNLPPKHEPDGES